MKMNPFESLLESYGKLRKQTYKFSTSDLLNEVNLPKALKDAGIQSSDFQRFKNIVFMVPNNVLSMWAEKQINANVSTKEGEGSTAQPGDIEVRENNPNVLYLHSTGGATSLEANQSDKFLKYLEYRLEGGTEEEAEEEEISVIESKLNETAVSIAAALEKLNIEGDRELMMNKIRFNTSEAGQKISTDIHRVLSLTTGVDLQTPDDEAYMEFLSDMKALADVANEMTDDGCIPESEQATALRNKFFIGSPGRANNSLMYGNLETESESDSNETEPLMLQQMRNYEGDLGLDKQGNQAFENFQGILVAPGAKSALRNLGVRLSEAKMCNSDEPFIKKQTTVAPAGGFYKVRGELNEMAVGLTKVILGILNAQRKGDNAQASELREGLSNVMIALGQAINVKRETLNKVVDMSLRLDSTINGEGFNNPLVDHAMSDVENYGTVFSDLPDLVKVVFSMAMKDAESVHWKAIIDTDTLQDVTPVTSIGNFDTNKLTGPLGSEESKAIGGGEGDTNKADSFLKIGSEESRQKICDKLKLSGFERERIMRTGLFPISDKFSTTSGEKTDLGNQSLTTLINPNTWSKLTNPVLEAGADPEIVRIAQSSAERHHASQQKYSSMMDKDAPNERAGDSIGAVEFQNTRSHVIGRLKEYSLSKYGAQHPIKKLADDTLNMMEKFNSAYKGMNFDNLEGRDLRKAREKYNAAKRDIVTNMMKMDELDYLEKLTGPQREREDKAFALMTALAGTDTNPFTVLNCKNHSDELSKQVTSSQIRKVIAGITTGQYEVRREGFSCVIFKGPKPIMSCKIRNRKGSQTTTCSIDSDEVSKL